MSESEEVRRARWAIYTAIERNAVEAFGGCVVERPSRLSPTYPPVRDVSPLAGARAARRAQAAAADRVRYYAAAARARGASWEEIGEALDLTATAARHGRPLGAAAFELVAEDREPGAPTRWPGWTPYTRWRCSSCGEWVTDHGPYDADAELGHAKGCERCDPGEGVS